MESATAGEIVTAAVIAKFLKGHQSGSGWAACCPAHDDRNPSLSICDSPDGRVLVKCHAGCEQVAVVAALKSLGLWAEKKPRQGRLIAATYDYTDENGKLMYQVVREDPKAFKQRRPDGVGGWIWKKHPNQVLYHLPEVLENPIVFLVEGEKDVEKLREHGFVATTSAGGAKAPWLISYTEALRGREVIIIPDSDPPGRQRAAIIARALFGNVASLFVLELDDAKDITEWFERGHSEVELISHLEAVAHAG
jgi:putative DNA primase/helicase